MESSCLPATLDSLTHASEANTPSEAIYILYRILENPSSSSEALRIKELAIFKLCDLLSQEKWAEDLKNLPIQLRPFFSLIPKAKTAKIVKELLMQWLKYRSGILHAQEKGYKVAYSYFYEAFETFNAFSRDPKDTSSKKDPDAKAKAKAI
ncbi:26S proteasome non-ATPase regulatory subunit 11 -like protein [Capsicum annuum]|nr:26S proteasome non-ATPase regulatory subunit 11 -like protein [Capsicum annuum]KAF3661961.1 26S proteasome non-ATPase regulatory subunit 11 -like protein [Capsicum annuum]